MAMLIGQVVLVSLDNKLKILDKNIVSIWPAVSIKEQTIVSDLSIYLSDCMF